MGEIPAAQSFNKGIPCLQQDIHQCLPLFVRQHIPGHERDHKTEHGIPLFPDPHHIIQGLAGKGLCRWRLPCLVDLPDVSQKFDDDRPGGDPRLPDAQGLQHGLRLLLHALGKQGKKKGLEIVHRRRQINGNSFKIAEDPGFDQGPDDTCNFCRPPVLIQEG